MANEELDALKPALAAIAQSDVVEASNLDSELIRFATVSQAADENRDVLKAAGLDLAEIDNLDKGIPALRSAEALWLISFENDDSHAQWAAQSDAAFALLRKLRRDLKHAFRKNPPLLKIVSEMAHGSTNAGMLLELRELAELAAKHADLMAAISFDTAKIDTALKFASDLSAIYADHHSNRGGDKVARDIRDRAYTYCLKASDEICQNGRYAFAEDAKMLEKFRSASHGKSKPAKPAPVTPPKQA